MADPTPLVLLVDEIDSLVGDTLLSVLRQLRAGYEQRPEGFPQSVVLCGVRDIHDYRIRLRSGEVIAGGSPFNVAAKSLRLGDFSEAETRALLAQHTAETGQAFTPEAMAMVWTRTQGQPWLVNALCADACFENKAGRDRSRAIAAGDILAARERLILSRRTHLDQLAHKLEEVRVRRVIEPMLSGGDEPRYHLHDLDYVRDLGLVAQGSPPRIANPIYAEVVAARAGLRPAGQSGPGPRLVRGRRWRPRCRQAARRLPGVLPRALRTLAGAVRVPGGGTAAHPASVLAAGGERRGGVSSASTAWAGGAPTC